LPTRPSPRRAQRAGAAAGNYSLEVQTLAQAHKLKSGSFTTYLGHRRHRHPYHPVRHLQRRHASRSTPTRRRRPSAIDSSKSSLAGVRDAINAANAGVSASIVNDGSGNRLVIASKDSGVANALKITVADDDADNTEQCRPVAARL
jgi:flagellar hook-associated protein 2